MIDEGELRERLPDIPWDEPVLVTVAGADGLTLTYYACRYCTAMYGVRAVEAASVPFFFPTRAEGLEHIEWEHHD